MRDFKRLEIWKRSHQFTLLIYSVTSSFPNEERFGLISQIRRASTSIAINIAEGCGRSTEKDFARFLVFAKSSLSEVQYILLLSRDLGFLNDQQYLDLADEADEIGKMIFAFHRKLSNKY